MSRTLEKHPKVDEVIGQRGDYFIYMKDGWTIDAVGSAHNDGCHCFGADTVKEALDILRTAEVCVGTCCKAKP